MARRRDAGRRVVRPPGSLFRPGAIIILLPGVLLALAACAGAPDAKDRGLTRSLAPPPVVQDPMLAEYEDRVVAAGGLRLEPMPADAPVTPEQLLESADAALFAAGGAAGGGAEARLVKWRRAPRYRLAGDGVAPGDQRVADSVARSIARATGLALTATPSRDDAGIALFVLTEDLRKATLAAALANAARADTRAQWARWVEEPTNVCLTLATADAGGGLTLATGYLKAEAPPRLRRRCIAEALARGMGVPFGSRRVGASIFNPEPVVADLTAVDRALLRLLYDRRIAPGASRETALAQMRALLDGRPPR